MERQSVIVLDSVTKMLGKKPRIENLSFACDSGMIYGLLGPNGSGRLILRFESHVLIGHREGERVARQLLVRKLEGFCCHGPLNEVMPLLPPSADVYLIPW